VVVGILGSAVGVFNLILYPPRHSQVIHFWLICETFYFVCVSENITVGLVTVWRQFFGILCVLISKLLYKCKYVCIFYLLVINKLSAFGL
jgi:hypothetical protein